MYRNDQIQAAIVAYLKTQATIVALLPAGAEEIRENQWQGTEFVYPNVRVRLIQNIPTQSNCERSDISLSIEVFSEQASSYEADRIAGIINTVLHKRSFTSNGIQMNLITTNLVPAWRRDNRTWQSEVLMKGILSG